MKTRSIVLTVGFFLIIHLSFAQQPKLGLPIGHLQGITVLQFSPNGNLILTASRDNTLKIWDASTGKILNSIVAANDIDGIKSAQFSPSGATIVTSSDSTSKVWEVTSGKLLTKLKGYDAQFSSDGEKIVTKIVPNWNPNYIQYDSAYLWDSQSGKRLTAWTGQDRMFKSPQFSPNGKMLVVHLWSGIKIIEIESGRLLTEILPFGNSSNSLSPQFSPDGKYLFNLYDSVDIFEVSSGESVQILSHKSPIISAQFSPDTKRIVTTDTSGVVRIWNTENWQLSVELIGHTSSVVSACFSPDGKKIVTASEDGTSKIWDAQNGNVLTEMVEFTSQASFSPDGKKVSTKLWNTAKVWDAESGKLLKSLEGNTNSARSAIFSHDQKKILTVSWNGTFNLWNVSDGQLSNLPGEGFAGSFSPDEKYVATGLMDGSTKIWDASDGGLITVLKGHTDFVEFTQFSLDSKRLITSSRDKSAKIWNIQSGKLLVNLVGHEGPVYSAKFSPDEKKIITASFDRTTKIWDAQRGNLLKTLNGHDGWINSSQFSPDGKKIVTASSDQTSRIWNAETGKALVILKGHTNSVETAEFSRDSKMVITKSLDGTSRIWNATTGKIIGEFKGHTADIEDVQFSADGTKIISSSRDNTSKIWDLESYKQLMELKGHENSVNTGQFSPDGKKIVTASDDARWKIWDAETGKEILSFIKIDSNDWVVTHSSGLFDASPGAMDKLYFVQGLAVIDFNQLKERYYEPGLWKKVMRGEELRNVVGMKSIDLPPDIQVGQVDGEGYLNIKLINRGGGIGEVNLFVNGKEIIKDARDGNVKPDAPNASIKVFVGKHKSIIKGQENLIAVKAWNKEHWVQSRGQIVTYQSKEIENYKPAVHILTCGISDYTGNEIDLKYAAKDANDMGVALQLGAKKLFGAERSFVYNLTTSQPKEFYPSKTNILKAFEKISSTAHPLDIFVMYVSGHGINYGGQDGDWHYLTQEAYTASAAAYNDPAIRAQTTISSNELVELFKKVPALKQVLMLDACASGKVVDNLMAQKDIESSTLRALDRMRDRTGMHIITGCTADAVSYEASKYGQGVLTYSLLEGIRGAALREDQYVDVNKLFQYAQDRVPQLAEGIGGIQSPQVFSPQGSQSFDIGLLSDVEKKEIPIAKIRPVYIRSNFQDENEMEDVLGLGKLINESLNEVSGKGIDSQIIFVDVADYPEGCKLIGRYRKENGQIILKLRKKCGAEDKTHDLKAADAEGLKLEILKVL